MKAPWHLLLLGALAAVGCVLPGYDKVGLDTRNAKMPDAGSADSGPALSPDAPAGASPACSACLASACSTAWDSCGPDCQKLKLPINPATPAPKAIDAFLACMQDNCEESCDLNWGCVGQYRWPVAAQDYSVTLRVVDMISSSALGGMRVTACQSSDPSCAEGSGLTGVGETDPTGHATVGVARDFNGFFSLQPKAGSDYLPTIATWTQPTYALNEGFTQRMLLVGVAESLAIFSDSHLIRDMSHLIFRTQNCLPIRYLDTPAPRGLADDVTVSFSPVANESSRVFYAGTGGVIDPTLGGTSHEGDSFGGAFNLLSRTITVIGKYHGMEVSRAGVQMRAGTVGFVYLVPRVR